MPTRPVTSVATPVLFQSLANSGVAAIDSPMSMAPPGRDQLPLSDRSIKTTKPPLLWFSTTQLTLGTKLLGAGASGSSM